MVWKSSVAKHKHILFIWRVEKTPIMKIRIEHIALLVLIGLSTSCTPKLVPFTHDIRQTLSENNLDIGRVQFYNSDQIVLSAMNPDSGLDVNKGVVESSNSKTINEVVFSEETHGKLLNHYDNLMEVTFEPIGGRFLTFSRKDPNDPYSHYVIKVTEEGQGFNQIIYDGNQYYLQEDGEYAILLIEKNKLNQITRKRRVAKGVRVK